MTADTLRLTRGFNTSSSFSGTSEILKHGHRSAVWLKKAGPDHQRHPG